MAWPTTLAVALGWGLAAALCGAVAWVAVAFAAGPAFALGLRTVPGEGHAEHAAQIAAVGAGCGLVVGTAVGILLVPRRWSAHQGLAALVVGAAATVSGAIGGGLSVVLPAEFPSLPLEASSGLGWAVAGLVAGFVGGVGRRYWPEADGGEVPRATTWAITGALAGAAPAVGGVLLGESYAVLPWLAEWSGRVWEAILYTAGTGAGVGLFLGLLLGLASGSRAFATRIGRGVRLGLLGAFTGVLAGTLAPLLALGMEPFAPPAVAFGVAGAATGLVAGLIGYTWTRPRPVPDAEADEGKPLAVAAPLRPLRTPVLRVLPVLAVSVLTVVAAMATSPPGTRMILITIGMLGLAVAHVQAGQERRLRELEGRLRQTPDAG
jgi:hypothetical protein